MIDPIYRPSGKALEYGELALNLYTGCSHGCKYCYAPKVVRKSREEFEDVKPRDGILEAIEKQLAKGKIKESLIHLCFTCDPYPTGHDTSVTTEAIKLIHNSGNYVQILTKNVSGAMKDEHLLSRGDRLGFTYTGDFEKKTTNKIVSSQDEIWTALNDAIEARYSTWVSIEPALNKEAIYKFLKFGPQVEVAKIGKLNYCTLESLGFDPINWADFGKKCNEIGRQSYMNVQLKDDLRKEVESKYGGNWIYGSFKMH